MSEITKRALGASLKHLMQKKTLDKITINDIAEDCGINRMTFYYHFQNIYDLVEWVLEEDAKKAIEGNKTYDTWQQGFLQLFDSLIDNKIFIMNIFHSMNKEQLYPYLYRVTYQLIADVVEEQAKGMVVSDDDKHFIADFYKYGFVGLVLDWIKDNMGGDPKLIIDRLAIVMYGNISRSLEACRLDPHPSNKGE